MSRGRTWLLPIRAATVAALSLISMTVALAAEDTILSSPGVTPFEVDYPEYFSKHDIVYLTPPYEGYEGFPIGNGNQAFSRPNLALLRTDHVGLCVALFGLVVSEGFPRPVISV